VIRIATALLVVLALLGAGGAGLVPPAAAADSTETPAARIVAIRAAHHLDYDRLVFELDGEAEAVQLDAAAPGETVLGVRARHEGAQPALPPNMSRIRGLLLDTVPAGTRIRVRGAGRARLFRLHGPPRLVVDVADPGAASFEPPEGTEAVAAAREPSAVLGTPPQAPVERPPVEPPRAEPPAPEPAGPATRPSEKPEEPPGGAEPGASPEPETKRTALRTPEMARVPRPEPSGPAEKLLRPPPPAPEGPAVPGGPSAQAPDGAEPPCAKTCPELAKRGELRPGVAVIACTLRICEEEARRLYTRGDFPEALAALEHIREGRTGMPAYELDRGLVLYALERYAEAVEAFDRVLRALPTSLRAGAQRGHALARLGRLEEAQAQLEKLLELPGLEREFKGISTSSYLRGNVGVLKLRQGKLAEAKADLEQALADDGSNRLAATMLHRVVPALEAGSLDPDAIGELERAYEDLALGRHEQAVEGFESVVARWPGFEATWWLLGEIHFARLDYAACEDVYGRAARSVPAATDFGAEKLRCRILRYGVGSTEGREAIAELRSLADAHPDNRRLRELLFALDL
jgi:tetratricopeptide (TPR) repeat protein